LLFFAPPKKSNQKKSGPEGLPANAGSLCFSACRALANSQDLLRLMVSKPSSARARLFPGSPATLGGTYGV
ncbi:MAG: hypothetical protein OEU51_03725, partial [Gammaproteobacteria bacterium]|nr:hypothetical protein [Gammaproteobacteria bacterium]